MPPKKQNAPSSSKAPVDKTFGMKNVPDRALQIQKNKSAKVQKYVQQVQNEQARAGKTPAALAKEKEKELRAKEKAAEEKRKKEEAELFKPVQAVQKVPFGVDPKTVLCAYFKAGTCDKGNKCKFSHDLNVGRKVEKKDLYSDAREDKENDTMDNWDEEKLRKVVLSKAGNPRTTTDIVCKYFIEAIETKKFGWFWECPNGQDCMYRHALPPGFVLKSEKKALDDAAKANTISLEEFLEVERHKLGPNLTPVTPETFAQWKKTRLDKKAAEQEALKKAKETQNAAGRVNGMSGRDLFDYRPEWFEEEDDEGDAEDAEGGGWDIERMRKETEAEAEREEELRMEEMRKEFETTSV
ncbi:related to TMA46-Protein putative involved in cytoplasmic ribosome function [Serendipita indica DSM 11827]|uniref:Zinc finger CCCH domain-containing protein 15 n=1 Tax=Serendipita indica (strain DSM 11827) TaxID=1109443 RepID=G4TX44_SERID|nr:related to TMA46-Protein putative involved in cytoplasmic ribosome function [Serendipita indica DSM 11827]